MRNIKTYAEYVNIHNEYVNNSIKTDMDKKSEKFIGKSRIDGFGIYQISLGDDTVFYKKTPNGYVFIPSLSDEFSETNQNGRIYDSKNYPSVDDVKTFASEYGKLHHPSFNDEYWVPETESTPGYHTKHPSKIANNYPENQGLKGNQGTNGIKGNHGIVIGYQNSKGYNEVTIEENPTQSKKGSYRLYEEKPKERKKGIWNLILSIFS